MMLHWVLRFRQMRSGSCSAQRQEFFVADALSSLGLCPPVRRALSSNNAIEARQPLTMARRQIDGKCDQANNYTLEGIDMNEPQNNLIEL